MVKNLSLRKIPADPKVAPDLYLFCPIFTQLSRWINITVSAGFILLLLAVTFKFILFTAYIQSHKSNFRSETFRQASGKPLAEYLLPIDKLFKDVNGVEWNDNNREIKIHGKFYEVIS